MIDFPNLLAKIQDKTWLLTPEKLFIEVKYAYYLWHKR